MTRYVSSCERTLGLREWNTLTELRAAALSQGCTPAQFAYAVEVMGTETKYVASYLQRHEFAVGLFKEKRQAA